MSSSPHDADHLITLKIGTPEYGQAMRAWKYWKGARCLGIALVGGFFLWLDARIFPDLFVGTCVGLILFLPLFFWFIDWYDQNFYMMVDHGTHDIEVAPWVGEQRDLENWLNRRKN